MKTLYSYITEDYDVPVMMNKIDGHVHFFDSDQYVFDYTTPVFEKSVGFIDVEPKRINKYTNCIGQYDAFIENHYDSDTMILLAASTSAEDMIAIHKKYPKIIKGFGEIKCYDEWKGKPLKLKGLMQYWDVFKYAGENNLPVYIHYSLNTDTDVQRLDKCLTKFPGTTFVLCHCGTDEFQEDKSVAIHSTITLMSNHSNLWTDISYTSLDYFSSNPMLLGQLPQDRIIIGSDINPVLFNKGKDDKTIYSKLQNIDKFVRSDANIKKLFHISA